jgi:hypothetical protein
LKRRTTHRGQSILYAVLLMPTLFLIAALAIDLARLQLERIRMEYALDLATVTAANSVDPISYSRTGILHLDSARAEIVAREYLLRNLRSSLTTPDPEQVAGSAEITIVNTVPARDPYRAVLLDRPAVCARIHVPYHFLLLGWIGMHTTTITVSAGAEIRP